MNAEALSVNVRARIHAALGDPARLTMVDILTLGDASPGELAQALELPTQPGGASRQGASREPDS